MDRVVIVGSGASGVHFALSVLRKGYDVLMLDIGNQGHEPVNVTDSFLDLKANLEDPVAYFLGENFDGVLYPDSTSEFYGIPPSKTHVLADLDEFAVKTKGFSPLVSFAQGGLAEAWTGGVYPFNDDDLERFPFRYKDIEPFYNEVAKRIGIAGVKDDLSRLMPVHENLLSPLELDDHSAVLLSEYERHKAFFNGKLRCYLGRSRSATLTKDLDGRHKCSNLGRCLWGCPSGAFYTPSITLQQCRRFSTFRYMKGMYVRYFKVDSDGRVTSVIAHSLANNSVEDFPVDKLVLAGGTLSSSRIFLASILKNAGEVVKLKGLMDNRQVLMPFVNLKMIGKPYDPETYQYHQIAMGIEGDKPHEYIHALITTLKTALVHPIIQKLPFDLKTSTFLFRNLHAALGLVNVNFHDTRRGDNYLTLEDQKHSSEPTLLVNYSPADHEAKSITKTIKIVKRVLWKLRCLVPSPMVHVRPMGASVHYAGTIPMSTNKASLTTSELCQSHDFDNLYIVDGTTMPFLPAKNITFTLMANAARVAELAF
jgi:choline dehydrogenase-like flavoprotein